MIVPFPQAFFFTSAGAVQEGSTEQRPSARTAVVGSALAVEGRHESADNGAVKEAPVSVDFGRSATSHSAGSFHGSAEPATRSVFDIFFDAIKATVEAFDGR